LFNMATTDVYTERLGVTGWLSGTVEKGGQALCGTICGCVLIPLCVFLVFFGEYNYVKDQNNIYQINKEMIEVTSYDPSNDGTAVNYQGPPMADLMYDARWGYSLENTFMTSYTGYIRAWQKSTTEQNNEKTITFTPIWSTSPGTQETYKDKTYNQYQFVASCDATNCIGSTTNQNSYVGNYTLTDYLLQDYTSHVASTLTTTDMYYSNCTGCEANGWVECNNNGKNFIANNQQRTNVKCRANGVGGDADPGDMYVEFFHYPSNQYSTVTVCSKQVAGANGKGTFDRLKSNGNYDLMLPGVNTKKDCIDEMTARATATVWLFRIFGFLGFWLGFVLLLSFVEFIADRLAQLIPCGMGEIFEESVHCIICCVTCPPATMCWMVWFALAWIIFRPLIGGCVLAAALVGFGLMYFYHKQTEKNKPAEAYAPLNPDGQTGYKPPAQQQQQQQQYQPQQPQYQPQPQPQYQPQQPQYQPQQPQYQPQQPQYQPQQPQYAPQQQYAPPPVYVAQSVDMNNNGVPDHYETNLPPGWEARMDVNTNRVYWVNHANNTTTWQDPRGAPPPQVYQT